MERFPFIYGEVAGARSGAVSGSDLEYVGIGLSRQRSRELAKARSLKGDDPGSGAIRGEEGRHAVKVHERVFAYGGKECGWRSCVRRGLPIYDTA